MDMLRDCVLGDNMGSLATPPSSYSLFFPSQKPKRKPDDVSSTIVSTRPTKTPRKQDTTTSASTSTPNGFLKNKARRSFPHTPGCQLILVMIILFMVNVLTPAVDCFMVSIPKIIQHLIGLSCLIGCLVLLPYIGNQLLKVLWTAFRQVVKVHLSHHSL